MLQWYMQSEIAKTQTLPTETGFSIQSMSNEQVRKKTTVLTAIMTKLNK